jgi:hypothetical protein
MHTIQAGHCPAFAFLSIIPDIPENPTKIPPWGFGKSAVILVKTPIDF